MRWSWALATVVLFSGCLAGQGGSNSGGEDDALRSGEPREQPIVPLQTFSFDLFGPVARGSPTTWAHEEGASEPVVVSAPDGTLFLRYHGCSDGTNRSAVSKVHFHEGLQQDFCVHGPMLRSRDGGLTWTTLNDASGRLSVEGPASYTTYDLAIDAAGTLYAIESSCRGVKEDGTRCQEDEVIVHTSTDQGDTWTYLGDILPPDQSWARIVHVAAAEAGHVVFAWEHGYTTGAFPAGLEVRTTFDGGRTLSPPVKIQQGLDTFGKPAFDADGLRVAIPHLVQVSPQLPPPAPPTISSELRVALSDDGGLSWTERSTGVVLHYPPAAYKCVTGAPGVAFTRDGVVVVYSEAIPRTSLFALKVIESSDSGLSWKPPIQVSLGPTQIQGSISPSGDNRVLVTYLDNDVPGDPNFMGEWDVRAAVVDLTTSEVKISTVDSNVHEGGLHLGAPVFTPNEGPDESFVSDESLGASFSHAILPDGRIVVAYVADPLSNGRTLQEIRIALQK